MRPATSQTAEELGRHIEEGRALIGRAGLVGDVSDYESFKAARRQWVEQTAETLGRLYEDSQELDEFRRDASVPPGDGSWQEEYVSDLNSLGRANEFLLSLTGELDLEQVRTDASELVEEHADVSVLAEGHSSDSPVAHEAVASELDHTLSAPEAPEDWEPERAPPGGPDPEPPMSAGATLGSAMPSNPQLAPAPPSASQPAGRRPALDDSVGTNGSVSPVHVPASAIGQSDQHTGRVFLVHGRNDRWKHAVVDLLERAGSHEVTIVNERTSARGMLVEEFVQQTTGQGYAVILLTADDIGAPRLEADREPYFTTRACQGVVFEMGYLAAALTPQCVCVLYEEGVELPCDLGGMVYVRLDQAGTWQSKLLTELRAAGFTYDLNRLAPIGQDAHITA